MNDVCEGTWKRKARFSYGVFELEEDVVHYAQCTACGELLHHDLTPDCFCNPFIEDSRSSGGKLIIVHRETGVA